jgi:hypothetical protein
VQQFAYDLRALREEGGRLSYQELAKRAHYAPNTLSEAAKGEKLPTLEVTRAFVKVCGGDQEAWEKRWWEVQDQLGRPRTDNGLPAAGTSTQTIDPAPSPDVPVEETTDVKRRPRRSWLAAAWVAVIVVLAGGGVLWRDHGLFPAASTPPRRLPLYLLRGVYADGGLIRIWAMTTDTTQAAQLTSSSARYERVGGVGDCYTRPEPGTVPVWHHTYKFQDGEHQQHLYTIETDPLQDEALRWGWTDHDSRPVCYVYSTPVPGAKPLFRMRENPLDQANALGDGHGHVYTSNRSSYRRFGFVVDQIWYLPTAKVREPPSDR